MFKNNNWMMFATLVILLAAIPTSALTNGSTRFTVADALLVGGSEVQSGDYEIKWESSNQDVTVIFVAKGKTVAKAQGKVVSKDKKSDGNALVIGRDSSNRKSLKEIRLSGKKEVLVFE